MEHRSRSPRAAGRTAGTRLRRARGVRTSARRARGTARRALRRAEPRPPGARGRRVRGGPRPRGRARVDHQALQRVDGNRTSMSSKACETLLELATNGTTRRPRRRSRLGPSRPRLRAAYPDRFVQCGIAEQDMVSTAGAWRATACCRSSTRSPPSWPRAANEQIYNQASEGSKVIYALHYAGLLPAARASRTRASATSRCSRRSRTSRSSSRARGRKHARSFGWAVQDAEESVAVRLAFGPSPRRIELPERAPAIGRGSVLARGATRSAISYGPVMLHEALLAAERLGESGEPSVRGRGDAVAQPLRPRLAQRRGSPLRTRLRARRSCAGGGARRRGSAALCPAASSPSSASKAGPRAGRPTRRSASTLWTVRRSRRGSPRTSASPLDELQAPLDRPPRSSRSAFSSIRGS